MGNAVSDTHKHATLNFVQPNETDNKTVFSKDPHRNINDSGMSPPPECPMHVKTEVKKDAGCAVAGAADDINPMNMVNTSEQLNSNIHLYKMCIMKTIYICVP